MRCIYVKSTSNWTKMYVGSTLKLTPINATSLQYYVRYMVTSTQSQPRYTFYSMQFF